MFEFLIRKVATGSANQADIKGFRDALHNLKTQQRFISLTNQIAAEYERRQNDIEADRAARRLRQELRIFEGWRNTHGH